MRKLLEGTTSYLLTCEMSKTVVVPESTANVSLTREEKALRYVARMSLCK